jgi:hypothetical protein
MLSMRTSSLAFAVFAALAALAAIITLAIASPAGASTTLLSQNFESGTFGTLTPVGQVGVNSGQDYVDIGGSGSVASRANHFASFGSGDRPSGSLTSPLFSTLAGETYTLTFDYGAWGQGTETIILGLLVDGLVTPQFFPTAPSTNLDAVFAPALVTFTPAVNGSLSFFFTSTSGISVDGFVDNISLVTTANLPGTSGVPEPASWAMMLLGFAGIGFAERRHRKAVRPPQLA